jgi:hypothetical protein
MPHSRPQKSGWHIPLSRAPLRQYVAGKSNLVRSYSILLHFCLLLHRPGDGFDEVGAQRRDVHRLHQAFLKPEPIVPAIQARTSTRVDVSIGLQRGQIVNLQSLYS